MSNALVVKNMLEENKGKIADILPSYLKNKPGYENKLVKAAMIAVNNPELRLDKCTPESILLSVMKAAELGLDPSGSLGSGYLIAYGDKCTFSPGYRGLIDLATRGEDSRVKAIWSYVVYENDKFSYRLGDSPRIEHEPAMLTKDRGAPIGVYMVASLKAGDNTIEVMTWSEVLEIRNMSKAKNGPAWTKFMGQMARKAVIRRGMNYLPLSPEIMSQLKLAFSDEDEYAGLSFAEKKQKKEEEAGRSMGFSRPTGPEPKDGDIVIDAEETKQEIDPNAGF